MHWIRHFQLFLFDFDGLLVNTEHLHYQAYVDMLARHDCHVHWSFTQYCSLAHLSAEAIRDQIYAEFPDLPDWKLLYAEKKQLYLELLSSGRVELMPGVQELLEA